MRSRPKLARLGKKLYCGYYTIGANKLHKLFTKKFYTQIEF